MRDKLRRRYQVHKEVARKGYFEGEIPVSELDRLRELMHDAEAGETPRMLSISFEFVRNEYDIPMMVGRLQTSLSLECQRCLKPLEMPIDLDIRLMVDASDELVRDSSIDTIYSDDGYIDINEVVEDELILAIPLVAMHDDKTCNEHWQAAENEAGATARENPFAVLQQLKTTN